jgi:hypothetical protein
MSSAIRPPHGSRARSVASSVFVVIALISAVISASVYAPMDDPFESDAKVLISTFGIGTAILTAVIALIPFRAGQWWAWAALWVWPVFFVVHVVALGTVVPDGILAVISTVALVLSRPAAPAATGRGRAGPTCTPCPTATLPRDPVPEQRGPGAAAPETGLRRLRAGESQTPPA